MKPALTAEEWEFEIGKRFFEILQADPEWCHRNAAMYLDDQPFGFTREDVSLLQEIAGNEMGCTDDDTLWKPLFDLTTRIEALLPPK